MSRPTNDERLALVHRDALIEFAQIQEAVRDERKQCLSDRRFATIRGAQWDGTLGQQFENKLKIEVNKVALSVIRIFNEYRNNRISVEFIPKPGKSDKLADSCAGLYRADEQDSSAEEAYDNAFDEGATGGYGALRLRCDYEDEESEEDERQRIRFEPIFDADCSVFFNLDSKKQDKSDAKRCYVLTSMSPAAYKEEYDDDPASWPKDAYPKGFDWATPNCVFVAELYKIEEKRDTIHIYQGLDGSEQRVKESAIKAEAQSVKDGEITMADTLVEKLRATGFREVRSKRVKRKRCHKYVMSGARVLEDCGYIAGPNIPVVPHYGKRWYIDNIERCQGHVRLSRDAQCLKNMQLSKLGELSALSSVEKPIMTPEEMAGHALMWSEDNVKNYPYLLKNRAYDLNGQPILSPQEYTRAPQIPPAMAALLQITETDMQDMLGNQQAGEQLQPNMSGVAVELVQNKLDMQAFIYMSNMGKTVRRCGEIWLGMAKEVYVEEGRTMNTVGTQGELDQITLQKPMLNDEGEVEYENDLSEADLDVTAQIGPSSQSKRAATVRSLTGMMQITQDPETLQVLSSMAMMNMEGEGISEVRDYFRKKLLRLGVIEPTQEEAAQLAQAQSQDKPDPNAVYLTAAAEQAAAAAQKARADAVLSVAKAEETKAKTAETMVGMEHARQDQVLKTVDALGNAMQPQQSVVP